MHNNGLEACASTRMKRRREGFTSTSSIVPPHPPFLPCLVLLACSSILITDETILPLPLNLPRPAHYIGTKHAETDPDIPFPTSHRLISHGVVHQNNKTLPPRRPPPSRPRCPCLLFLHSPRPRQGLGRFPLAFPPTAQGPATTAQVHLGPLVHDAGRGGRKGRLVKGRRRKGRSAEKIELEGGSGQGRQGRRVRREAILF